MRRLVLVAVIGILALGAAALLVVELASRPSSLDGGGAPTEPPADAVRPTANPSGPLAALPELTPEQRAWADAPTLPATLPTVAAAIGQPLAPCFDEEVQARFGPMVHSSLPGATGAGPYPATLVLQVEVVPGGLRIVDAPVAALGRAGDGLVACAQQALRGRIVPVDAIPQRPGDRFAMPYTLSPAAQVAPSPAPAAAPASRDSGTAPARPVFRRQRGKGVPPPQP